MKALQEQSSSIENLKVKVGSYQARYLKAGSGPPVLLVHGGADDSSTWIETIAALSGSYTCYAPDLIGFGRSDNPKSSYHISDFAEFILDFINALGLKTVALVGHSLGGRICLEVAFRAPGKLSKLVLVSATGFCRLSRLGSFLGTAAWGVRKALRRPQPYPKFLIREDEDRDWRCLDALPALKIPTLIIWGDRDPYYPLAQAIHARNLLPSARWEVIAGTGHAPHRRKMDVFVGLLRSFLGDRR